MNYSKAHEAILNEMGQAPQVGNLEMNLPKTPSLGLLLLLIIAMLSHVFINVSLPIYKWGWSSRACTNAWITYTIDSLFHPPGGLLISSTLEGAC